MKERRAFLGVAAVRAGAEYSGSAVAWQANGWSSGQTAQDQRTRLGDGQGETND